MFPLSVQCAWERVQNDPRIVMVLAHFVKVMVGSRTACERDRERESELDKPTDRQKDKETERDKVRDTMRETQKDRPSEKERNGVRDKERYKNSKTERET